MTATPEAPQGKTGVDAAGASVRRGGGKLLAGGSTPSLAVQAYQAIKTRILSLELTPGQFVNEKILGEMVGFSRMPVHQAVHRLQAEGLLDIISRKGIAIRATSLNEILTLLEARAAVEPSIAAMAAQRATRKQVQAIGAIVRQSSKLLDQNHDRRSSMALDRAFHFQVAEAAGNPVLVEALLPLHERSVRVWSVRVWGPDGLKLTQQEHEAVYGAIAEKDAEAARRAMAWHIEQLESRLLDGAQSGGLLVPSVWDGP